MSASTRAALSDAPTSVSIDRFSWLWLLLGIVLAPFIGWQTVIPLAAWLLPVFLLRFERTSRRALVALPLIFLAYLYGTYVAGRGLDFNPLGFVGNMILKPLLWTLPYAADRALGRRLSGWPRMLIFPLAFTVADWVLATSKLSSTGSPAYSQFDNLALIQIVSITGIWGLTFLVMWFASTANEFWERRFDWRLARGKAGAFVAVLLAAMIFGSVRLAFAAPAATTVSAAAITQDAAVLHSANTDPSIDWSTIYKASDAQRAAARPKLEATVAEMLARSETALRAGAKIVSWQEEGALTLAEDEPSVLARAGALAKQYDAYIEVSLGVITRAQALPFLRDQSILIDNGGNVVWTYDKTDLVPYDEAFFTIAGPGTLPVSDSPYGRLSTAICYDTYFPSLLRQAGRGDADILFAPSNDVRPYASSALVMDQYRAVEEGVSTIRPTGNGVSLITDYEGRVLGSQDYGASGILMTGVPTHGATTIYSRIGDVFAYACVAGLVVVAATAMVRRRRPKHVPS